MFTHPSAPVIGNVHIGEDGPVWCNTVLRGGVNRITIGHSSSIQDLAMGYVSQENLNTFSCGVAPRIRDGRIAGGY